MRHQFESGFFRDVPELPVAVVLEQRVAAANRRDEQILIAVVVVSANDAATLIRFGRATPAWLVMFPNRPRPDSSRARCRRPD
jgi:hypothetical protein